MSTATDTLGAGPMGADDELETVSDKVRNKSREHSFGLFLSALLLVFVVIVFWPRIVITIHSGEEGVMWNRFFGTQLDVIYKEGTHLIWPWDEMYIYDIRINKVDYTVPILSTDGLEIKVEVNIRYRPAEKSVPQLHQEVGPDYVARLVIPEVVTAVREVMGSYRPDQLYTLRTVEMQNMIVARAATQLQDRYIEIDDVLIRRIELPEALQSAIQAKMRQEQAALEYRYRLDRENAEKTRKEIEANGIAEFVRIAFGGGAALPAGTPIANSPEAMQRYLTLKGIEATLELAKSDNSKVVVIGAGQNGLLLNLGADAAATAAGAAAAPAVRR